MAFAMAPQLLQNTLKHIHAYTYLFSSGSLKP